ncbi:P2X purinoceptor 7-like [Protopterus annectens]|uniref:P2X purinoceptor 7-like n=1 Tax=Protopterus annectens TaxID=7888 RepID=UPI001CF9CC73|nr:P2X purinoceptor 7-like [Protopterus annectens]
MFGMNMHGPVPFSFEPEYAPGERRPKRRRDSNGSSDVEEHEENTQSMTWCTCEKCVLMNTPQECYCCVSSHRARAKIAQLELAVQPVCITDHTDFEMACLTPLVLELILRSMHYVTRRSRSIQWTNRLYRVVAYRAYVLWIFENRRLGRGNRVVIPACVVSRIRQKFPEDDNEYVGFLPFDGFWVYPE